MKKTLASTDDGAKTLDDLIATLGTAFFLLLEVDGVTEVQIPKKHTGSTSIRIEIFLSKMPQQSCQLSW